MCACMCVLHAWGSTGFSLVLKLINSAKLASLYLSPRNLLSPLSIGLNTLGHHLHFYVALKESNSGPRDCATSSLPNSIIITSKWLSKAHNAGMWQSAWLLIYRRSWLPSYYQWCIVVLGPLALQEGAEGRLYSPWLLLCVGVFPLMW